MPLKIEINTADTILVKMRVDYYVIVTIPSEVVMTIELQKIEGHIGRVEEIRHHPQAGEMIRLHNLDGWISAGLLKEVRHLEEHEWKKTRLLGDGKD